MFKIISPFHLVGGILGWFIGFSVICIIKFPDPVAYCISIFFMILGAVVTEHLNKNK